MTEQLEAEKMALTSGLRFTQPPARRSGLSQEVPPQALLCQQRTVCSCWL